MALCIAFGEVEDPLGRVVVLPAPGGRSAFRIHNPFATEREPAVVEVEYPSGESRPVADETAAPIVGASPFFDLDGDEV